MTAAPIIAPRARADLAAIFSYTRKRWGIEQAKFYVRRIDQRIAAIAARPELGKPCFEIRTGYFKHPADAHILFYRQTSGGIEIIRVLHAGMDVARHL